jgi:hypothetical protein
MLLFLVVISAALSTLLATSPEPPAVDLAVITSATPAMDYYYGVVPQAFICPGEEAIITWELHNSSSAKLRAKPADNLTPALDNVAIGQKGQRRVRVLDEVSIILADDYDYEVQISLLANALCQPINLTGTFSGTLEQLEPTQVSLARTLKLAATNVDMSGTLLTATEFPERSFFDCSYQGAIVSCQHQSYINGEAGEVDVSLTGTMTETTFSGSYEGFDETTSARIPFSGTFSFTRQELALAD